MALTYPLAGMCESGRCAGEARWAGVLAVGGGVGLLEAFFTYRQAKSLRKAILEWAELPANLLSRRSTFSFAATVDALAMVTALWLLSFEPTWVPLNIYWGALAVVVAVIARLNRTVTWAFDEVAGAVV